MYDPKQLRKYIKDVLWLFGSMVSKELATDDAVELLMFTAAHESKLGTYLVQLNDGPAKGIFQMEPDTAFDIQNNYLRYREDIYKAVRDFELESLPYDINLQGNLAYQIVMARVHYLRVPEAIPSKDNVFAMARYYKEHWNTHKGAATVQGAINSYTEYVTQREK